MPRLTRTQKFAELRDSLANDKESSLQTKDLSNYEDRLNSITEILSPQSYKEEAAPVYEAPAPAVETPVYENKSEENDPKYTWTDFEETPVEQLVDSFKNNDLEDQIQQMDAAVPNWPSAEEQIVSAPVQEKVEEVSIASTAETKPLIDEPVYEAPVIDKPIIREEENIKPLIDESQYISSYTDIDYNYEEPSYTAPLIDDSAPKQETVEEAKPQVEETVYPGYYRPSPEVEALYKEAEAKKEEEVKPLIETPDFDHVERLEEAAPVVETPAVEETAAPAPIIDDAFIDDLPIATIAEETAQAPVEEAPVETPAPVEEYVDNHAVDYEATTNSYISDTIDEVGRYNMAKGDMTISQLTNNMVNEVRHHEEPQVQTPAVEEKPVVTPLVTPVQAPVEEAVLDTTNEDDEFSNTVSMEIDKIIDDIKEVEAKEAKEEKVIEQAPAIEPILDVEEIEDVKVAEPAPVEETPAPVEEHPVKAIAQEEPQEEVVEIKNLKELEAEPVRDTVSNTIPFVVATEEDEEEIEDDDEEGSNTILNIILIVLIIVLIAVLGLIVFYILKTKGIL